MQISESYKKRLKSLSGILSEGVFNIQELDAEEVSIPASYIKDSLNPKVWKNDKLNPKIREHLLTIAKEYIKYLKIDVAPEHILFLGSMANYNWNDSSDFDLHLVYDFSKISDDIDFAKDFFDTKGANWKSNHTIKIKGYDVEIYVQEKSEENKSVGVFDLQKNDWIRKPKKEDVSIDKELIKKKAASIASSIEYVEELAKTESNSKKVYKQSKKIKDKIKKMRQAGLDKSGEFSAENLAFKYLRNNGYLEKLGNIASQSFDNNLSMNEAEHGIDSKFLKTVIFKNKNRPQIIITVKKTPDGRIVELENNFNINFPFKIGQILNRNHEVWACNNHYLVDDKDTCPEEKIFGIRKKDIPQGHELRILFPGKFRNESQMKESELKDRVPSREELEIRRIAKKGNLEISRYDMNQLIMGYNVEKEHGSINPITNITNDDEIKTLKIALAHLNEVNDYYTKLKKCVETGINESSYPWMNISSVGPKKILKESVETNSKLKHKIIVKKSVDNLDENKIKLIKEFIIDCCEELGIDKPCCVYFTGERGGPITTTASYNPNNDHIWIYTKNRNMLADPLRSLAHEIRHFKQKLDGVLVETSGEDGSPHENEANSFSGYMIRKFGRENRGIYE